LASSAVSFGASAQADQWPSAGGDVNLSPAIPNPVVPTSDGMSLVSYSIRNSRFVEFRSSEKTEDPAWSIFAMLLTPGRSG
jgi:hypothetical protein